MIAGAEPTRVGLVGAGRGGTALLQLLAGARMARVVAVADPNPEAPGFTLARAHDIPVVRCHREIFAYVPQVVIEATGRRDVLEELLAARPADVEVVGARSAWLFWELLGIRAREAQELERAATIRRMTGGIFHSLNNLFAILGGRASLLLRAVESDRWSPASLAEGLQMIARTVTHGSDILKRLRGLFRDSVDKSVTRMDVNGLVHEVVALAEPLIRESLGRPVAIEVRQVLGEVPPVVGRPPELLEVLVNLIVNAVEAMPAGGVLTLETAREGSDALLRVRDTGVGIPDPVKVQLFTPFFTTKAGGTGLGLSASREIVRQHGGDLVVESAEGQGSCFTVRLPGAEERLPPDLRGWRVLVVDDDPLIRDVLAQVLAAEGCGVTTAAGGEEALAYLEREPYDLVLADIVMPDLPGWQVAQTARARDPAPVVILFSGWAPRPEDPALPESGADAFLRKPIRLTELIETVQSVLARRSGVPRVSS